MTGRDPLDWLRSVNPVPDSRLGPDPRDDPDALAILERVLGAAESHTRRRRHLRFLIPAVVVAAATAATGWALTREADDPTQVGCYASADLQADIIGLPLAVGDDPIAACAAVWSEGGFGSSGTPDLAACVLPGGLAGVFPATDGDPCSQFALDPLERPASAGADTVRELQERLSTRFGSTCVDLDAARRESQDLINELGLSDWSISVPDPGDQTRRCASLALDPEQHIVTIVPLPATPPG